MRRFRDPLDSDCCDEVGCEFKKPEKPAVTVVAKRRVVSTRGWRGVELGEDVACSFSSALRDAGGSVVASLDWEVECGGANALGKELMSGGGLSGKSGVVRSFVGMEMRVGRRLPGRRLCNFFQIPETERS